jgi:salicylate hydroxylase
MMKLTPYVYRTRWMTREEDIDDWIDESGRIVLIGEAAHPWFVSCSIPQLPAASI